MKLLSVELHGRMAASIVEPVSEGNARAVVPCFRSGAGWKFQATELDLEYSDIEKYFAGKKLKTSETSQQAAQTAARGVNLQLKNFLV